MANSTITNLDSVMQNTIVAGARCYKTGRVVYLIIDKNDVTANVDETIATIPKGFRPIYGISLRDSLNGHRIYVATNGNIVAGEVISNNNIRGGVTYICE